MKAKADVYQCLNPGCEAVWNRGEMEGQNLNCPSCGWPCRFSPAKTAKVWARPKWVKYLPFVGIVLAYWLLKKSEVRWELRTSEEGTKVVLVRREWWSAKRFRVEIVDGKARYWTGRDWGHLPEELDHDYEPERGESQQFPYAD